MCQTRVRDVDPKRKGSASVFLPVAMVTPLRAEDVAVDGMGWGALSAQWRGQWPSSSPGDVGQGAFLVSDGWMRRRRMGRPLVSSRCETCRYGRSKGRGQLVGAGPRGRV